MYCSKCGVENKGNKFCYNCGNPINGEIINNKSKSGNEETSLVLGIICLISSFFLSVICFIPGIISIVYAKKYKKESGKLGVGFGLSLGGMIYSFVMLIICVLFFLLIVSTVNDIDNEYNYNTNTEFTSSLPRI